ncbi:MAG: TMEM175 family protein [Litorimonas sp.]
MIRETVGRQLDHDPNFRWRGESVTRIENLSDIAFAVALGMIITGVDAPRNFDQLIEFLVFGIPAAACFAVLLGIWTAHYTFFRRYGVADGTIVFLNALLIFLILYMAYPLRFAFDSFYSWIVGMTTGNASRIMQIGVDSFEVSGWIIALFAVIYGLSHMLIALMYTHVIRRRALLALSPYELALTRQQHLAKWLQAGLAFLAATLGYYTSLNGFAGFIMSFNFVPALLAKRIHKADPLDTAPV